MRKKYRMLIFILLVIALAFAVGVMAGVYYSANFGVMLAEKFLDIKLNERGAELLIRYGRRLSEI